MPLRQLSYYIWLIRGQSRILRQVPFHLELGIRTWNTKSRSDYKTVSEILSPSWYFDWLRPSVPCVQCPIWVRVIDCRNQKMKKQNFWEGRIQTHNNLQETVIIYIPSPNMVCRWFLFLVKEHFRTMPIQDREHI